MGNTKINCLALLDTLSSIGSIVGGTSNGMVKLYPDMITPIHMEQIIVHYGNTN